MENQFLQTLRHLRVHEEVLLSGNLLQFSDLHEQEVVEFLKAEYVSESNDYPYSPPDYSPGAALWAARTFYISAQLLLNRENREADLEGLLQPYQYERSSSAMLSADLLLRFLPDLIQHLKTVDPIDKLPEILESHLKDWHYSGISYPLPVHELDFTAIKSNPCLFQLYVDRIIEYRKISLAQLTDLRKMIRASLGDFTGVLWPELSNQLIEQDEQN
jgi:hypothetical protein